MIIFLSILSFVLFVLLCVAVFYIVKLARVIFHYEDELSMIQNRLIETYERLEQVLAIRIFAEHLIAGRFMKEAAAELKHCELLILRMVEKSKMLINKNYSKNLSPIPELSGLHDRLIENGEYNPEFDDGVHMLSEEEKKLNKN